MASKTITFTRTQTIEVSFDDWFETKTLPRDLALKQWKAMCRSTTDGEFRMEDDEDGMTYDDVEGDLDDLEEECPIAEIKAAMEAEKAREAAIRAAYEKTLAEEKAALKKLKIDELKKQLAELEK